MQSNLKRLSVAIVALLLLAAIWISQTQSRVEKPPAPIPAIAKTESQPSRPPVSVPEVEEPSAPEVPVAPLPINTNELVGTEQMFEAHAPLRVPEVANPDSATNRKVLETMVLKALARAHDSSARSLGDDSK